MATLTLSPDERAARGKAARGQASRSSHAAWRLPADRRGPIAALEEQARPRGPELVPIRYGRMVESPFAYFRGAAAAMADDLSRTPASGLRVQLCGDAHLSNFGGFASPNRDLVFDLNDFDETLPGPWEWDLKRLIASFEIAGRSRDFDRDQRRATVTAAAREYRLAMRRFATMPDLAVWYARLDADEVIRRWGAEEDGKAAKLVRRAADKARAKDSMRALAKLTCRVDGELRIASDAPLVVRIEELVGPDDGRDVSEEIGRVLQAYRRTLSGGARHALAPYRLVDVARKVVGVGSVGTRAHIVLLLGRDAEDPLFLQVKEAERSVLEGFAGKSPFKQDGRRVVEGQRLMQAASDIFLGWLTVETGVDGKPHDYYVRQLWDGKGSAEIETMTPGRMLQYARF